MLRLVGLADQGARQDASKTVVWIVDPIDYSGMAYYDAGLADALTSLGVRVLVLGSDRRLIGGHGERWRTVPIFRGTSGSGRRLSRGWRYLVSLARLVVEARRLRPGVMHWQYTELPVIDLLVMHVLRWSGIRQAYTAHELLPWDVRPYHRMVFRLLYRTVDVVFVHGDVEAHDLTSTWGLQAGRVTITGHGDYGSFASPELPQREARRRLGLAPEVPIALFFGSLRPSKGLAVLLEAWASVVSAEPSARLVVAGRPYKHVDTRSLVEATRRLGVEASVDFRFGEIPPIQANDFYRAADVVTLPYLQITTSGVMRYAYSSGRAIVATAVGEHTTSVVPRNHRVARSSR